MLYVVIPRHALVSSKRNINTRKNPPRAGIGDRLIGRSLGVLLIVVIAQLLTDDGAWRFVDLCTFFVLYSPIPWLVVFFSNNASS